MPAMTRDVGEVEVAVVAIEGGVLFAEVGDGEADAAVVDVVAEGNAHVGLLEAVFADGDAALEGDVLEVAVAIVVIEVVGLAIVGDEEVELAVVVEVGPDGGEAEEVVGVVDAGWLWRRR